MIHEMKHLFKSCGGRSGDLRNIFHLIIPAVAPRSGSFFVSWKGPPQAKRERRLTECDHQQQH